AVILYGGFSVMSGVRTQGDFIAFITSMFLLYEPLKKVGRVNTIFQTGVAAAERVFELLDTKSDIQDRPDATALVPLQPQNEFRNVTFSYETPTNGDREPEIALKNISLEVRPGETVALVGMSGGGKSTLVTLLPRFYDPTSGAVLINGKDIRDYTLSSLRQAM